MTYQLCLVLLFPADGVSVVQRSLLDPTSVVFRFDISKSTSTSTSIRTSTKYEYAYDYKFGQGGCAGSGSLLLQMHAN